MDMNVSFRANAAPQEQAVAKSSAKASLLGTAITATGGAIAGGVIGAAASFLPCQPSVDKVIDEMKLNGDKLAKDYFEKHAEFKNIELAKDISDNLEKLKNLPEPIENVRETIDELTSKLKDLPDPKNFENAKKTLDDAYNALREKAVDLIKNAPESDIVQTAKKATKSMFRPNRIAKGICYGAMIALAYNIISSFRKPKDGQ